MARNRFPTMDQAVRIALSKRVRCRYAPCSAPVDSPCVNTSDGPGRGRELGGLGAHLVRLQDAEARWPVAGPPAPRPAADPRVTRALVGA